MAELWLNQYAIAQEKAREQKELKAKAEKKAKELHELKVNSIKTILKSHGIKMSIDSCGCCDSPIVSFEYMGGSVMKDEGYVVFDMFEDEDNES